MNLTHLEHGDRHVACRPRNPSQPTVARTDKPRLVTCGKCRQTEWFRMLTRVAA